jgi:hypothetical protein
MVYRVGFDTIRKGWLPNFTLAPWNVAHPCAKKSPHAFISRLCIFSITWGWQHTVPKVSSKNLVERLKPSGRFPFFLR